MSGYKSNYGINQLTPEYLYYLTNADFFGPTITKNGKYYITTLNPNVNILTVPETVSYNPNDDNYYGKYYGVSLVINQTTSTDDAEVLISNAREKWVEAYDSGFKTPYQLGQNADEIDQYIKEVESTTGREIEHFELGDNHPTIWYRDDDGNLVDQPVEIKPNPNIDKQLQEIEDYYKGIYGEDKKVKVIKKENGNYALMVDDDEVKEFSLNKYDMSAIEQSIGTPNKVKSSEILGDDNKAYLENYYKEMYKDQDVKIIKNEDGSYSLLIGDDKKVDFEKGATIAEALTQANNELNDGKAMKTPNKGQNTRGLDDLTGQGYRIYINVKDFENVQSSHNMANGILDGCTTMYRTDMFTEKLAEAYSSLIGLEGNTDPTNRIAKTSELLSNIVINVHYSLEAYKNIDHDLGIVINSVIEEIFNVNSYDNIHSEFNNLTLEEKEKRLDTMIKYLDESIKDLQDDYDRYYTNYLGAPVPESFAQFLVGLADAFSLDGTQKDVKYYSDENYSKYGTVRLDFDQITTTMNFLKEHDVINKLGSYAGTANQGSTIASEAWEQSGMAELNKYILANSNVSDYTNEQKNDYAERLFLTRFINSQGDFRNEFNDKYGQDPSNFLLDQGLWGNNDPNGYYVIRRDLINDIKGLISTKLNETVTIKTYEIDEEKLALGDKDVNKYKSFNVFELYDYYTSEEFKQAEQELNDSILSLKNTKYNYEQYREVMPFLEYKSSEKYLEYLAKDYSKYDVMYDALGNKIQFLSQEEIALYYMLKDSEGEEKALKYLSSMEDMIAQREGFQLAAERIYGMNQNGEDPLDFTNSGWNGLTDGLEGFFRNIGNFFYSDGKRDAVDYRNMFMLQLLSQDSIYNDKLSKEYRDILKRNYNVMNSVGQVMIPALSRFIPYVGWAVSPALMAMSSFGGSVEYAKQLGKSDVQAYLYGGFQACSTLVLYKLASGIPGLGNGQIPNGWLDFATNIGRAAERAVLSTYVDATLRATILQEPVDFSHLPEQALDQALTSMYVSAVMQAGTKAVFKLADGITIKLSGGEYNSYQDFLADTEAQFKATPAGQRLLKLYHMDDKSAWKEYKKNHKGSIIVKMVEEMKDDKSFNPENCTDRAEELIGIKLDPQERLMYDPNDDNFYIVNLKTGGGMTVPGDWLSNSSAGQTSANNQALSSYGNLPSVYTGSGDVSSSVDGVNPSNLVGLKTGPSIPTFSGNTDDALIAAGSTGDQDVTINGNNVDVIPSENLPQTTAMPKTLTPEDIMLVHATDYLPIDKTIKSTGDLGVGTRYTVHLSCNGLVKGGFSGAGDWEHSKYVILEPGKYHFGDSSLRGGFAGDVYYDKPFELKEPTIIMSQQSYDDLSPEERSQLGGYKILIKAFDLNSKDVSNAIKMAGYHAVDPTSVPATGIDYTGDRENERLTPEQRAFEEAFTKMISESNQEGITEARTRLLHARSKEMAYEQTMKNAEAVLSDSRGTSVPIGREPVEISEKEFLSMIDPYGDPKTLMDSDKVLDGMNRYGISYDPNTDKYYVGSIDDWRRMNQDQSIYGDKTRAEDAARRYWKDKPEEIISLREKELQEKTGKPYVFKVTEDGKVIVTLDKPLSLLDDDTVDAAELKGKEGRAINGKSGTDIGVTYDVDDLINGLDEDVILRTLKDQTEQALNEVVAERNKDSSTPNGSSNATDLSTRDAVSSFSSGYNADFTSEEAQQFLIKTSNGYGFDHTAFSKFLRDNGRYKTDTPIYSKDNLPSTKGSVTLGEGIAYVDYGNQYGGRTLPVEFPDTQYVIVKKSDLDNIKTVSDSGESTGYELLITGDTSKVEYQNGQAVYEKMPLVDGKTMSDITGIAALEGNGVDDYVVALVSTKAFDEHGTLIGKNGERISSHDVSGFNPELIKTVPLGTEVTDLKVVAGPGSEDVYRNASDKYAQDDRFLSNNPNGYWKMEGSIKTTSGETLKVHFTIDEYGNVYYFGDDYPKIKESKKYESQDRLDQTAPTWDDANDSAHYELIDGEVTPISVEDLMKIYPYDKLQTILTPEELKSLNADAKKVDQLKYGDIYKEIKELYTPGELLSSGVDPKSLTSIYSMDEIKTSLSFDELCNNFSPKQIKRMYTTDELLQKSSSSQLTTLFTTKELKKMGSIDYYYKEKGFTREQLISIYGNDAVNNYLGGNNE